MKRRLGGAFGMAAQAARGARAQKKLRARLASAAAVVVPRFRPPARAPTEQKAIDIALATYQVNTTGAFTLLNGCIQGTDFNERIGRKIIPRSVYIRGQMYPELARTSVTAGVQETLAQLGRMILFVDLQPNGAAPAVTDLLNTASSFSQLNLNNRDRFRILVDKAFAFPNAVKAFTALGSTSGTYGSNFKLKIYKKLQMETIYNSGNAGTIADIQSGALYILWLGSEASGTTDINAMATVRLRFSDP